ncbi:MAG TPA: 30S ribosomal protein S2 [Rhizobiales bacterium]|nr:30S ribosomal protein S2 [Hyphomicrobiales bacterium]
MALPEFTMRQLLEAGVHFGHQKRRWNPKMGSYIFGARNNIHIIDLAQTVPLLHQALVAVSDIVAGGGRVLFVGTKRQASQPIEDAAKRCAQYYINHRWLGGTMTNWQTISKTIKRLHELENLLGGEAQGLTKKELLKMTRERDKLDRAIGGIKDMGGLPNILFVVDTLKESIAIKEAQKLGIPVAAVLDSNSDPDGITYPIPGNDDAGRAIELYVDLIAKAAIDGIERAQTSAGMDLGEAVEPVMEETVLVTETVEEAKEEAAEVMAEAGEETPAVEEAPAKEEAPLAFAPMSAPDGEPDDLKKISGVGPVIEEKLHELGIYHYHQIAGFSPEDVTRIDDQLNFKGRIERDNWIEQAKAMAAEAK